MERELNGLAFNCKLWPVADNALQEALDRYELKDKVYNHPGLGFFGCGKMLSNIVADHYLSLFQLPPRYKITGTGFVRALDYLQTYAGQDTLHRGLQELCTDIGVFIIPILTGGHFVVYLVDRRDRYNVRVAYYDSIDRGEPNADDVEVLRKFLNVPALQPVIGQTGRQTNGHDCGVHALMTVHALVEKLTEAGYDGFSFDDALLRLTDYPYIVRDDDEGTEAYMIKLSRAWMLSNLKTGQWSEFSFQTAMSLAPMLE